MNFRSLQNMKLKYYSFNYGVGVFLTIISLQLVCLLYHIYEGSVYCEGQPDRTGEIEISTAL
jgi:hypothetical protein